MTDIVIPSLSGIARMVPLHTNTVLTNVGADWTADVYTVPTGRVLALDWAMLVCRGGLLPTTLSMQLLDSASTRQAWLIREKPSTIDDPALITNTVWVAEGWKVHFLYGAGDSTTDITWSLSGRLFDWKDVT